MSEIKQEKTKKSKKLKIVVLSLVVVLLLYTVSKIVLADLNYAHNSVVEESFTFVNADGLITMQNKTNEFKFGVANSNYNGCGWIAIYNAAKILGLDITMAEVIKEVELTSSVFLGVFGSNPLTLAHFFERRGYQVNYYFNPSEYENAVRTSKVGLMAYINYANWFRGHWQTVEKYDNDNLIFYNYNKIMNMDSYLALYPTTLTMLVTIN